MSRTSELSARARATLVPSPRAFFEPVSTPEGVVRIEWRGECDTYLEDQSDRSGAGVPSFRTSQGDPHCDLRASGVETEEYMPLETAVREHIERQEDGLAFSEAKGTTRCSIPPI